VEQTRYPHYAGPGACIAMALVVATLRHMRAAGRHAGRGPARERFAVAASVGLTVALAATPGHFVDASRPAHTSWCCSTPGNIARAAVLERLRNLPGRHLAIVRNAPDHDWMNEWVWNEADIDHAKVVWARDRGDGNADLLRYFHERSVWVVEPDAVPPRVTRMVMGARP
jgi:hypothetical protein